MGQPYLSVVRMWGNEQLCQLFEYEIELRTPDVVDRDAGFDTEVDLREMNGRELTARIGLPDPGAAPREISGIVTRAWNKRCRCCAAYCCELSDFSCRSAHLAIPRKPYRSEYWNRDYR